MKIQGLVLAIVVSLSAPIFAQNSLAPISMFAKKGAPVSAECQQEMQVVAKLASLYPHPSSGWKFYVVCDESSWKAFMQRTFMSQDSMQHYGETDIDKGVTVFRGWMLIHPDMGVTPEHIVSHELAHIMMHSRDEAKVDAQAKVWMQQQQQNPGSLVATLTATNSPTH